MAEAAKKKAYVIKSFSDAGTKQNFTAGATPLLDPGAFENYKAAGLVRAPDAPARAPKKAPVKKAASKRKSAPKKTAPKTKAPVPVATGDIPAAPLALPTEDHAPSA